MSCHGKFHRFLVAIFAVIFAAGCFEPGQRWTLVVSVPMLVFLVLSEEMTASPDPRPVRRRSR